MAFQQTPAPSEYLRALKRGEEVSKDLPKRLSKEEWKKQKDLEEQRKAGNVPAMVDEEGRDINPHIPHYISQAPWYFGAGTATLKHQKTDELLKQRPLTIKEELVDKGLCLRSVATKFRKGACENCGAISHKRKDCLERPRKVGAKHTGEDIAPDEFIVPDMALDFEGKRDRWRGFDASAHKQVVEEFEKLEEARRLIKADQMKQEQAEKGEVVEDIEVDSNDVKEEDKYAESASMVGTKVDSRQRITVRNLRIREDTAKYLVNLDINSAYYDPKTRSMRDDPRKNKTGAAGAGDDNIFIGENFTRSTGETTEILRAQVFAWHAAERGVDTHVNAEPTKLEMLQREYEAEKTRLKGSITQAVIDKYGGVEHFDKPPNELLLSQSEAYVEYSRGGRVIKGNIDDKRKILSRYAEDHYINNHSTVWGSHWRNCHWGYACCRSFVRNSYCLGVANIHRDESFSDAKIDVHQFGARGNSDKLTSAEEETEKTLQNDDEAVEEASRVPALNSMVDAAVLPGNVAVAVTANLPVERTEAAIAELPRSPSNLKKDLVELRKKRRRHSSSVSSATTSSDSDEAGSTSSSLSSSSSDDREQKRGKKKQIKSSKNGISARRRLRAAEEGEQRNGKEKAATSKSDVKSDQKQTRRRRSSSFTESDRDDVDRRLKRLAPDMDTKKLKEALRQEDARLKSGDIGEKFGTKAKYYSKYDTKKVTAEEMEAFRIKQVHADDPMAAYVATQKKNG